MGMAASQVRLLALTSRLHDVELKAQGIMSQKLALATQKDELYKDYCEALDKTKITVGYMDKSGDTYRVDANFSSLCEYVDPSVRTQAYVLHDNLSGLIYTSQEVADTYDIYHNDKYAFAYAMLGFGKQFAWAGSDFDGDCGRWIGIGTNSAPNVDTGDYMDCDGDGTDDLYMTPCEMKAYNDKADDKLIEMYNKILTATDDKDKAKLLEEFRTELYEKCDDLIYDYMNKNKQGGAGLWDEREWKDISSEFNYYVDLWEAINEAGGCKVIDSEFESGDKGTEWLTNMVQAGVISIWTKSCKDKEWSETNVATSTNNNYLQEEQDEKDLKKAEAKYEYELDKINAKDTKFDTELDKLETERTAITTQMDSIKKVKDDNIDRTFGIFG